MIDTPLANPTDAAAPVGTRFAVRRNPTGDYFAGVQDFNARFGEVPARLLRPDAEYRLARCVERAALGESFELVAV